MKSLLLLCVMSLCAMHMTAGAPDPTHRALAFEQLLNAIINNDEKVQLEAANPSPAPLHNHQEHKENVIIEQANHDFRHIYSLDMKDPGQTCPANWRMTVTNSLRLCGKKTGNSCDSVFIHTNGQSYQYVRGQITAYQYSSPDAFRVSSKSIDGGYMDGISITHGHNPRKHIFTLAVGVVQYYEPQGDRRFYTCPGTGYGQPQPSFVANNYFCSSAPPGPDLDVALYPDTPLWSDGVDCDECSDPRIFCVKLPQPTTDPIELRICTDEPVNTEDIRIETIDMYVK